MNGCISIYAKQYSSVSSVVDSQIFLLFFSEPLSIVMRCLNSLRTEIVRMKKSVSQEPAQTKTW